MAEADPETEVHRTIPTTPEATESLLEVAEGGEAFTEPSGTAAEARREGATLPTEGSQLDDAAARQAKLEQVREQMWETTHSTGGVGGLGVQEEETARISDHLVFPGTGIREMRDRGAVQESMQDLAANADVPSPTDNPDRFPPAEWPPKDEAQGEG
jgi:hypothetical protein